jgi:SET domain
MICEDAEHGGRCYVALRPLACGEVVIEEEPYAMVTRDPYREVACCWCATLCVGGKVLTLSSEDRYRYCSEACITNDYAVHQHELQALKRLQEAGTDPSALVVRVAATRKTEGENEEDGVTAPAEVCNGRKNRFAHVMLLEAASRHVPEEALASLQKASLRLTVICKLGNIPLSQPEAYHLLLAQQCNAHQIHDEGEGGAAAVALGLFPLTSMLNHSCVPNCAHSFLIRPGQRPKLVMRTIRACEAGEQLTYNYCRLYASTSTRRAQLERCYSFVCDCPRCNGVESDAYIEGDDGSEAAKAALSAVREDTAQFDDAQRLIDATKRLLYSGTVAPGHIAVVQAGATLLKNAKCASKEVAALGCVALASIHRHVQRHQPPGSVLDLGEIKIMAKQVATLLNDATLDDAEVKEALGFETGQTELCEGLALAKKISIEY